MERRDFMKLCSLAGLGLVGTGLSGTKDAKAAPMADKLFVEVSAGGGWDITAGIDPKGAPMNALYTPGDIMQFGNLTVAPDIDVNLGTITPTGGPYYNFFSKWGSRWTIIRGIDCETNGHDTGQMNTWSGRLQNGSPAFAALLAAATGRERPLSFIVNGGYSYTAGVMAPTRLGDVGTLQGLIYPNRINPEEDASPLYHTDETFKRIVATRQARLDKFQQLQNLPKIKQSMSLLYTSRLGMEDLKLINDYLPEGDLPGGMAGQAAIILAAYKAGLTTAATLSTGGFDSHGQNDDAQWPNQAQLFNGVDALLTQAEALGIIDNLVVMVGSDFGRTPEYNDAQGRDHWSIGAAMIMAPGIQGNRVIGSSDDSLVNVKMDLGTGAPTALTNGHIHKWLRKYFQIENEEVVKLYPINKEGELVL